MRFILKMDYLTMTKNTTKLTQIRLKIVHIWQMSYNILLTLAIKHMYQSSKMNLFILKSIFMIK